MELTRITLDNYAQEVGQSEKPVLIDFYADWCGPCKMLAPEVDAFAQENENIKVCKLNVDDCQDLALVYGIMSIPALILIKDGKEVGRKIGGCEKKDIEAFCNEHLK